ncbi:hypothetical protein QF028_000379 [Neobacillus sp. B4I6]|uniref:hypothetical protein n=1 Tax=Neobacillus sp. B4I6 TaxID=3373925 RepID=UPI003D2033B0
MVVATTSGTQRFEHETRIRNLYANNLNHLRANEILIGTEQWYTGTRLRVDMRTVGENGVLREWEFKIFADYDALGQIITYVAMSRLREKFERPVQGVIAAFSFHEEIPKAIEVMNLGIELVTIPRWMRLAGKIPDDSEFTSTASGITIPSN